MMKQFDWKLFWKKFLIYFMIAMIILIPANVALSKAGNVRIFSGTENLMKDMDYIINPDSPFYEEFSNSQRVNILVLGVNDGLTDTIMLGSYDMKNQRVDVISVPRDTYYYREGYKNQASHKINAIYSKGGAVGTAEAVSDVLLGIPINYYVTVDYDAVEKVVDQMGGVPMDIPFPMKYDDPRDTPPLHIDIPEGQQTLDGEHAVQYLRYRKEYVQGDIGRVGAQQAFVEAAFKQALTSDFIGTVKVALAEVESDIPLGLALKIASKAVNLEAEKLTTYLADGKSGTNKGASFWYVDEELVGEIITQIYSPPQEEEDGQGGGENGKSREKDQKKEE